MPTKDLSGNAICSWPESIRPRERLCRDGVRVLSDAELLAVVLRSGIKGKDAVCLGREILVRFGGLRGLGAAELHDLAEIRGLGLAKITTLLAVGEIARRQQREDLRGKSVLRDPESVREYLRCDLRDRKKEIFKVFFLDKANRILSDKDLFEGTVDQAAIHPREILKEAMRCHAVALIFAHNHPSGRTLPSAEDREITARLCRVCEAVGITILDHLIVGETEFFSFRENGLLC